MREMSNPTGKHRRKRRHHGEGTVIKRNDHWRRKPWVAVVPYTDASGRRRETWYSAASRQEAEELRREKLRERAIDTVPSEHTVGSYVADWLMTTDLGPWTHDRYRHHIERRIVPTLGDIALASLTAPAVRQAMMKWSGAAATRMGTFVVLRAAVKQAVADRLLASDPTLNIKGPRPKARTPDVLDVAEARHLMDTVRGERFAPILVASLGLGIRRGEALGLRTPDIDFAAGTVTIRHSLRRVPISARDDGDGWWRLVSPKRDSGRTIPLPAFVADALRERIAERDADKRAAKVWAPNDLVFCDRHGDPVSFTSLDTWFHQALERAGLPRIRWHALRASSATILLAEGVDEMTVSAILGHTTLEMTARYIKVLPRMGRAAADKMQGAVG